jgi:hypothetical protein
MTDERRKGMEDLGKQLAVLQNTLNSHVEQGEADMKEVKKGQKDNTASINCIKRTLEKQRGFFAGIAFAFTFVAGIIWFLVNKAFP